MDKRRSESATGFPLNDERVAALLDGRLAGAERDAVLAQLAADPEWRDVLVEAAIVLDDVSSRRDAEGTQIRMVDAAVTPENAKHGLRIEPDGASRASMARRLVPWVGLAAAAIAFMVLRKGDGVLSSLRAGGADPGAAYTVAMAPEALEVLQRDRWSVQRAATDSVSAIGRAVRLGVWAVDAGLDRAGGGQEARDAMVELLAPVPGAGPVTALLRAATDSTSSAQAFAAVRALVESEAFDLGVGLELALAGAQRDGRALAQQLERVARRSEYAREMGEAVVLLASESGANATDLQRAASRALEVVAR